MGQLPLKIPAPSSGRQGTRKRAAKSVLDSSTLIRRALGEEPGSAHLAIKGNAHDFGYYYSVVCYFDDLDEEAYAYRCEDEAPSRWDHVVSANHLARVCDSCREAAYDEGIPDRETQELMMVELGGEMADHLCLHVEPPNDPPPCLCGCRRRR